MARKWRDNGEIMAKSGEMTVWGGGGAMSIHMNSFSCEQADGLFARMVVTCE
jgi:hypothetical protein